ncbi:MAG TPA: polysaccharide deacetylase family protein [Brumimicrobium sp.]|nr:polysaccharide deacetylase family protein [Brumimicrobium sp.]
MAWIFPRRIWFGKNGSVCLTFDDGPHPEITPWLLDELKKEDVKATFFWNGDKIEKHPELLARAVNDGHLVGHHGFAHLSGKTLSLTDFQANFHQSKALVETGLFRPPYGSLKQKQAKYALENGELVMWSWMSYDFDSKVPLQKLFQKAEKQIRSRDVLVFHENDKTVDRIKEIIPKIIQIVRDKELNFALIEKKR